MKLDYASFHKGGKAMPEWLSQIIWALAALVLLLVFNALFTPGFFELEIKSGALYGSLIDILNHGSRTMLLALGMCLVIATGGVDLSVGAIMAIAGAIAVEILCIPNIDPTWGLVLSLSAAILASLACGAWNGALVTMFRIQPIVATLILMVSGRGVAQLITEGQIPLTTHPGFVYIGNGKLLGLPFPVTIVAVMCLLTWLLTRKTALGLFIESVGDNEKASYFAGLNAGVVKFSVYVFCGFCAGLAGLIYASNIRAADSNNAGMFMELDAIIAVVVGGTALTGGRFNLLGAIIGALLIQTLTTTLYMRDVSPPVIPVYKSLVVLAVCLIRSPVFRAQMLSPLRLMRRTA